MLSALLAIAGVLIPVVEKFFPPKSGKDKEETVVNALSSVAVTMNGPIDQGALFVEGLKEVISGIVKIQNAIGAFKKS